MKDKKLFCVGEIYKINLNSSTFAIGPIPFETLIQVYSEDARVFGLLADHLISVMFDNMELKGSCKSFDLIEYPKAGGARIWEAKAASKGNPVSLVRSSHKGTGRKFNLEEHLAWQENLAGYIIVDLAHLPTLRLIGRPMKWFKKVGSLNCCEVSRKNMETLLFFPEDLLFSEGELLEIATKPELY
jgi:hypothetical protein